MAASDRDLQVLGSFVAGLVFAGLGAHILWTGSFSTQRYGSGLIVSGTWASVVGVCCVILGLLFLLAPFLQMWWRRRGRRSN